MIEIFRAGVSRAVMLPMLSRAVAAGFPSPADDFIESEIDLSRLLISNRPATFLVRVRGSSMIRARLFDGDLAIVDRSIVPRNGDVVVVDVDGERSFKVWHRGNEGVTLSFANPDFPDFPMAADAAIDVWGVVINVISLGRRAGL